MPGVAGAAQLKEVTKSMVESVKTRKIEYDEEALSEDPSVIILNPRKMKPQEGKVEREGKGASIAEPL